MANRLKGDVRMSETPDFRGSLEKDRGALPYADGSAESTVANVMGTLANKFGGYADRAAAIEGERAGKIAGQDPNYRPDGATTIRGRAFEQAATATYSDKLETDIREKSWGAFHEWKALPPDQQTPGALEERLKKVREDIQPNVFPEIQGEVDKRISALNETFRNHAIESYDAHIKDQRQAALMTSINTISTSAQQAAILDPESPTIDKEHQAALAKIDQEEKDGTIDSTVAAKQRMAINRTIGETRWQGRAQKATTATEVAGLIKDLDDLHAKDKAGLDADGYDATRGMLEQRMRALHAQQASTNHLFGNQLKDAVQRTVDGFDVPESELSGLRMSATTPETQAAMGLAERKMAIAKSLRGRPVEEIEAAAASYRAKLNQNGGAGSADADLVTFAEDIARKAREARATDPLGAAAKQGLPVAPVAFDNPDAMVATLKQRSADARAVAQNVNAPVTFFRPDEKKQLIDVSLEGGERALQTAKALVQGLGADTPRALEELGEKAPTLAHIGNLLAMGGPNAEAVARDALEAARLRKVDGAKLPDLDITTTSQIFNDEVSNGLAWQGQTRQRIQSTARDLWQVRVTREAVDPKSDRAKELYREALQDAAGRSLVKDVAYGGVADYAPEGGWFGMRQSAKKVPVPANIRADRLADVIGALRDSDFDSSRAEGDTRTKPVDDKGNAIPAATLKRAHLVYTSRGYRFALGDPMSRDPKFIRSSSGGPFELNLQEWESILRPRVPKAYLGGEQ